MPVHDVAKAQELNAQACNFITGSVQRIISKGKIAVCILLFFSEHHPLSFLSVPLNFDRTNLMKFATNDKTCINSI
jgi:hypothetical protein